MCAREPFQGKVGCSPSTWISFIWKKSCSSQTIFSKILLKSAPFLCCLTHFSADVRAFRELCHWVLVHAASVLVHEAQHSAEVPWEPLGRCKSPIVLLGVVSILSPRGLALMALSGCRP